MKGLLLGSFVVTLALSACGTSTLQQTLRPAQPTSATADLGQPNQKRQGLVVTDNPYTVSSDRLEQMNKGGFGGY